MDLRFRSDKHGDGCPGRKSGRQNRWRRPIPVEHRSFETIGGQTAHGWGHTVKGLGMVQPTGDSNKWASSQTKAVGHEGDEAKSLDHRRLSRVVAPYQHSDGSKGDLMVLETSEVLERERFDHSRGAFQIPAGEVLSRGA
jgi:hypothetical protein